MNTQEIIQLIANDGCNATVGAATLTYIAIMTLAMVAFIIGLTILFDIVQWTDKERRRAAGLAVLAVLTALLTIPIINAELAKQTQIEEGKIISILHTNFTMSIVKEGKTGVDDGATLFCISVPGHTRNDPKDQFFLTRDQAATLERTMIVSANRADQNTAWHWVAQYGIL